MEEAGKHDGTISANDGENPDLCTSAGSEIVIRLSKRRWLVSIILLYVA